MTGRFPVVTSVGTIARIPLGGLGQLQDVPSRTKRAARSIAELLLGIAHRLCPGFSVRLIAREIGSCYQRIRLSRKNKWDTSGLLFEQVRRSIPLCEDSSHSMESQSYIRHIRMLMQERPYLTLADVELFVQGWAQAEKCLCRTNHTEACKKTQDS